MCVHVGRNENQVDTPALMVSRHPGVSGGEGAAAADDDQPAERPQGAAAGGPLRAEEHGRPAAGEAAAADGAGPAAAGAGTASCRNIISRMI